MVIFHSYVSLPEGMSFSWIWMKGPPPKKAHICTQTTCNFPQNIPGYSSILPTSPPNRRWGLPGRLANCWTRRKWKAELVPSSEVVIIGSSTDQNWCRIRELISHRKLGYITGWWFGTMEFYDFPIILGISSSQLTLTPSFFRGVGLKPPAR